MSGKLLADLKQTRPFPTLETEAFLNLQRTADTLLRSMTDLLKQAELSPAQYNVLRILRGAGEAGLSCGEIAERMVSRDPDITRLLDRLEHRSLLVRSRERADRRVVRSRITPSGVRTVDRLDQPVDDLVLRRLGHLGAVRLRRLIALLEAARENAPS